MPACLITSGIVADCDDLKKVGGLAKKAWVANLDDIASTTVTDGYVSAITFDTYGGLYAFESKKGSFSAGYAVANSGAGANKFFTHTVVMKLFPSNPTDDAVIEDLLVGTVVTIVQTQNDEFLIYGLANGLDLTEGGYNSGQEAASDTTDTITLTGEEKTKAVRMLDTDVATTLALLESYEL